MDTISLVVLERNSCLSRHIGPPRVLGQDLVEPDAGAGGNVGDTYAATLGDSDGGPDDVFELEAPEVVLAVETSSDGNVAVKAVCFWLQGGSHVEVFFFLGSRLFSLILHLGKLREIFARFLTLYSSCCS